VITVIFIGMKQLTVEFARAAALSCACEKSRRRGRPTPRPSARRPAIRPIGSIPDNVPAYPAGSSSSSEVAAAASLVLVVVAVPVEDLDGELLDE
jgi:hypothetical protein